MVVRKAFGVAAGIHLGREATVVAWPSAEAGALPVESGVALAYRREIAGGWKRAPSARIGEEGARGA